ncbi:MAG: 7-cyano-7-deazaguanine synthase QueC [Candidatus Latescibacterota bacterium]|jgi:7-cyano-7-deazaguanine synthase|nr:7-cyano-7-deazaguanine synthase QueC [Candidatus Latescibacterota bacterium]MEE2726420.1 7-cyano-7-deazaguanine synthase QueC [Candidatus Latescibacterota bacterium]
MEKALLLSGGMDSTTLLWWMRARGDDVHAISIDYNQRHRVELQWATALTSQLNIPHKTISLDLSTIGGSPLTDRALDVPSAASAEQVRTVVPFRNMLFVTLAAAYAETQGMSELYLAPVRDDFTAYRDCRRPFYDSLEESLGLGATRETEFRLHTPFVEWWKVDVVKEGIALGVPYEKTHTCYEGRRPACGRCDACAERIAAFRDNGVCDPLEYEVDIAW